MKKINGIKKSVKEEIEEFDEKYAWDKIIKRRPDSLSKKIGPSLRILSNVKIIQKQIGRQEI